MRLFKKILIFPIVLLFTVVLSLRLFSWFLSYEKTVNARILVVEGWMPDQGLDRAYHEFQSGSYDMILITGSILENHITMYINSFLVFYPDFESDQFTEVNKQVFTIYAESTLGRTDSAHFNFWVNDTMLAGFFTSNSSGAFNVEWEGSIDSIDSLMIQFTNDKISNSGDRNLQINNVFLNGKNILDENTPRFLDRGRPFGLYRWNIKANSYAEMAAHYFLDRGVDRERVIPISNHFQNKRRTFGNAVALRDWLNENVDGKPALNVISMDYHSRRTWMTYKKVLKEQRVGIISVYNPGKEQSRFRKYYYVVRESIAMLYYAFFILPWI